MGVCSLQDLAVRLGLSVDMLRLKVRTNPEVRALLGRIGRTWLVPVGNIERLSSLLSRPARATA